MTLYTFTLCTSDQIEQLGQLQQNETFLTTISFKSTVVYLQFL